MTLRAKVWRLKSYYGKLLEDRIMAVWSEGSNAKSSPHSCAVIWEPARLMTHFMFKFKSIFQMSGIMCNSICFNALQAMLRSAEPA